MVAIQVVPLVQVMLEGDRVATNLSRVQNVALNVGKDSVRSLNPAKSPVLTVQLYADAAMFHTRQYAEGQSVWLSVEPEDRSRALWFTGILDEPLYKLVPGQRTRIDLRAFGLTSKLRGTVVNVPIKTDVSIRDAIIAVLDAAGWANDKRDIAATGLTATIPFWWVQEQSAWEALEDLMNAAGPPAQMYEDASGNLVVLGTTWVSADTTAPIRAGSTQDEPGIGREIRADTDATDVVNRAVIRRATYALADAAAVWEYGEDIAVAADSTTRIYVRFSDPVSALVTPEVDTDYTLDTAEGVTFELEDATAFTTTVKITATETRTISDLQLTGQELAKSGDSTVFNEDTDSISEIGEREWTASVPPALSRPYAEGVAHNIVNAYKEGISSWRFTMVANRNEDVFDAVSDMTVLSPMRLMVGAEMFDTRVREITWRFQDVRLFADVVVDQDGGLLQAGAGPFVLGTSLLDGPNYLWV